MTRSLDEGVQLHPSSVRGNSAQLEYGLDSRADKKVLWREIVFLRDALATTRAENRSLGERLSEAQERYDVLVAKNQDRLDSMIEKQNEIIDQRLGLNQPIAQRTQGQQTVQRSNAQELRSKLQEFEQKRREEHWKAKIEQVERDDKMKAAQKTPTVKENA